MEALIRELLVRIGEDPSRPGLEKTPERVAEAMEFFTCGYKKDPRQILAESILEVSYEEVILVKDIDIFSLCEHHLLPFFGKCHVGYIPNGKLVGLSKLVRVVEAYSRRLQVQERLTDQVARTLEELLQPQAVGVLIQAQHLCMMMRGVEKENSLVLTSCMLGKFKEVPAARGEFLSLI
ncbi:MAG: GTP cyclohydrolase I FolE, partial [Nitrospinota bacterium]